MYILLGREGTTARIRLCTASSRTSGYKSPCRGIASQARRRRASLWREMFLVGHSTTNVAPKLGTLVMEDDAYLAEREPLPFLVIHEVDTRDAVWQDIDHADGC